MVNPTILETAKRFIRQIPAEMDLKKAFLFGSHAKGTESEDSDIDIAVVVGKMDDFFALQMQLMRMRRNVDLRIEPHPFSDKEFNNENPLAFEIQKNGIALE